MEVRTLCDIFYRSVGTFRRAELMRFKKGDAWHSLSTDEFRTAVEELSMGLRALGIERGRSAAILSENRPEWAFADLATLCAGAVDTPIYATLTPPQILYILNDCEAELIFVSNAAQAAKIAAIRSEAKHLRHVVQMDLPATPGTISMEEVRALGRPALAADPEAVRKRAADVKPEDLATLIYTSGTTGDPKGVMLVHSNLTSNVLGSLAAFSGIGPEDVALSFLPLCHVFERMGGHYLMLYVGATIAYAESVDKVPQNMLEVRPTLMLSVPRLYEKMYARVNDKVAADSALRQRLFRWALGVGREAFRHRWQKTPVPAFLALEHRLADALVFAKIRERTGGRLRLFVSGGAPLAREIAEFFGSVGLLILEGYGLTETSPVICVNLPDALKPGTVGRPLPRVEVKIADDGEILTRGPHVMKGYYKKPDATAEALEPEGWFHTGDIGVLDGDGFLVITDRKKDLLVTSGGKKIAPQPIESRLKTNKYFAEIVMIGNKRNYACALIVPNFDNLEKWAKQSGLAYSGREELVAKREVAAHYKQVVNEMTQDLAPFEKIKKVVVLPREFTLERGELTPTLKVKRKVVEQNYKDLIDALYGGGEPA